MVGEASKSDQSAEDEASSMLEELVLVELEVSTLDDEVSDVADPTEVADVADPTEVADVVSPTEEAEVVAELVVVLSVEEAVRVAVETGLVEPDADRVARSESQMPLPSCRGAVEDNDDADVVAELASLEALKLDDVDDVGTGSVRSCLREEESADERGLGLSKSVWIDSSMVRVWLVFTSLAEEVCVLVLEERNDEREVSVIEPGAVDVPDEDSSESVVLESVTVWGLVDFLEAV
ncbi:hypothetical protein IWW39_004981 [Coemansia spiralis]|uniref:Uncharacterized protein n=1 Tax=Coemansia spiralis TaxID=417178 RepID=A0A9W8GII1_9FUNG|nr:hypothetical protein IWW39_004981 [Coemansia spiralis]